MRTKLQYSNSYTVYPPHIWYISVINRHMGPQLTGCPYQSCFYTRLDPSAMSTGPYELNMSTIYWCRPIKFMPPHSGADIKQAGRCAALRAIV